MSSSEPPLYFDLPWDFPVTPEALRVLRENPLQPGKDFWEQFQLIVDQLPGVEEALRKRPTFAGCEPFEL
jgi:hypothetical protein